MEFNFLKEQSVPRTHFFIHFKESIIKIFPESAVIED